MLTTMRSLSMCRCPRVQGHEDRTASGACQPPNEALDFFGAEDDWQSLRCLGQRQIVTLEGTF